MIPVVFSPPRSGHPSVFCLVAIRARILLATLAIGASLGIPQAWATTAPTTTTLTITSSGSEVTSVAAGTVITLTATVVSGTTPVNPGQVRFCDAAAKYCEDSALLATAQLTTAGTATYKFRPGIGSHSYQAVFVGTSSCAKSISSTATLTVTGLHPTTTSIVSSGSIGDYSLTATAVGTGSPSFSPTGKVSFLDTSNSNASLGAATLGPGTRTVNFPMSLTTAVGLCPDSVAVGDWNGDGIPDLATTDQCAEAVTVLLGNGDGTFTVKSSPAVPESVVGIATGDFNGDGIPDLLVNLGAGNPGSFMVLLGKGDGTFTAKPYFHAGNDASFPFSFALGDFNADGILDLAIANSGNSTVTVLLGNGDGTFAAKSSTDVGNSPVAITVADFNGDGILDLATANYGGNTVTVLLGNGDGTFSAGSTADVGSEPWSIVAGDFNGDGIPDLATGNQGDNTVTVLLGQGNGTFTTASTPNVGSLPISIAVTDLNGDGISDLAVAFQNGAAVLFSNGNGTFTVQAIPTLGSLPSSLVVADFNGDGAPDLAANNNDEDASEVTVLLSQITETATAALSNVSVPSAGGESHQVEASYAGDTNYSSSISSTIPLYAASIATTIALTSNVSTSTAGNTITLTAILSPHSSGSLTTDGETVTFYNGGTSIGTATLSAGVATLNLSPIPGTYTLTASYSGIAPFAGSTSASVGLTILQVATTLQLYSSTNPSTQGAPTTLTAVFSPNYSGNFQITGETVTFYNGGTSIGSAPLSFGGVATLTVSSLPNGIDTLTASYPGDGIFSPATSNTVSQAVGVPFPPLPNFVVTVTTDTTTGVASNCTGAHSPNCSLRDALAAANAAGAGNIIFDPTVFATPQTIAGGQSIPPHTTITGPTTGSGATLTNLVTVSGGGTVFTVNQFVTNAAISGLTITGGGSQEGGGILNSGALTVSNSTISGNSASVQRRRASRISAL